MSRDLTRQAKLTTDYSEYSLKYLRVEAFIASTVAGAGVLLDTIRVTGAPVTIAVRRTLARILADEFRVALSRGTIAVLTTVGANRKATNAVGATAGVAAATVTTAGLAARVAAAVAGRTGVGAGVGAGAVGAGKQPPLRGLHTIVGHGERFRLPDCDTQQYGDRE